MLFQVEEGLCEGRVLYHKHIVKTSGQKEEMQSKTEAREALRKDRKRIQVRILKERDFQWVSLTFGNMLQRPKLWVCTHTSQVFHHCRGTGTLTSIAAHCTAGF